MDQIIIRGGHVLDPGSGTDRVMDLVIRDGLIAEPDDSQETTGQIVIDAAGLLVTPGWIDAHLHIYPLLPTGVPAEAVCFATGVTTAVDAGSAGCGTYPLYRPFLNSGMLRTKAFLNVSTAGIISHPLPENVDPAAMDPVRIRDVIQACPELLGLKIRCSRDIVGEFGLRPLDRCLEIAEELGLPVMVHPTDPPCPMRDILDRLRPGDILSHVYHNIGPCILDESGHVSDTVWKARERGVLFDAANDRRHFGFSTPLPALREHFYPDLITSDLTGLDMYQYPTVFSLPMLASKYLNLGMALPEIIERVTSIPARITGLSAETGALRPGMCGDVAVFRIEERRVTFGDRRFTDPDCCCIEGQQVIKPLLTLRGGRIVFRDISV